MDQNFLDEIYSLSEDFFNLSETIKNKYSIPENGGARGYTPFGKETALGEKVPILRSSGITDLKSINISMTYS